VELIERGNALDMLQGALDSAAHGAVARAGLWRSGHRQDFLVTELVSTHRDGPVLWGGCEALFSPRPLGPLYDMARALGSKLQSMLGLDGRRVELFASFLAGLQEAPAPA
jgi:hypothetical protein